jgi:hypothetical protein
VPYLGTEAKQILTFPNSNLEQKEMIALFKEQASKQGVHLTTVASSSNSDSSQGRFFKLACNRFQAHTNVSNKYDGTSQQSTTPSPLKLYNPNVKAGTLQSSKTTRGLAGKKMPRRSATTKSRSKSQCCSFNFTFKLNHDTDCWELTGGTSSCQHQFHPKAILELSPTKGPSVRIFRSNKFPSKCLDNHPFLDGVGTHLFSAELSEKEARQQ